MNTKSKFILVSPSIQNLKIINDWNVYYSKKYHETSVLYKLNFLQQLKIIHDCNVYFPQKYHETSVLCWFSVYTALSVIIGVRLKPEKPRARVTAGVAR